MFLLKAWVSEREKKWGEKGTSGKGRISSPSPQKHFKNDPFHRDDLKCSHLIKRVILDWRGVILWSCLESLHHFPTFQHINQRGQGLVSPLLKLGPRLDQLHVQVMVHGAPTASATWSSLAVLTCIGLHASAFSGHSRTFLRDESWMGATCRTMPLMLPKNSLLTPS